MKRKVAIYSQILLPINFIILGIFHSQYWFIVFISYVIVSLAYWTKAAYEITWESFNKTKLSSKIKEANQAEVIVELIKLQPKNMIERMFLIHDYYFNTDSNLVLKFDNKVENELNKKYQ